MKCIQCGNEIPEGARFCPKCGAENFAPNPQEEVVNPVVEPQSAEVNETTPPMPPEPPGPEPPRPVEPINNGPVVPTQPKEEKKKSHNKAYIIIIAILSLVIIGLVCVLIFGEDWGIMCNDSSSTREADKSDSKDKESSSKDKDNDNAEEENPSKDPDKNVPSVETTTQKVVCTQYFDDYSGTYTFSAINNEIVGLEMTIKFSYEYLGLDYETLTPEDREVFTEEFIKNFPENQVGVQITTEFNPSTIDVKLNVDFTTADPSSLEGLLDFDGSEDMNLERVIERAKADGAICY